MKLYALFIGINKYAVERHNLQGCVDDMQAMLDFLSNHCTKTGIEFLPKVLTDENATRNKIIDGFKHFDKSKNGDTCVLYYSGHGSQAPCPPEFDESDGLCETIVCHDSRLPGGTDILDKELGALIYAATSDKDVHFTAIMDCCHAGSNTRTIDGRTFTVRMAEPAHIVKSYKDLWGYKDKLYRETTDENGNLKLSVKQNPYFHLAAAQSNQTAKELPLAGGITRGAFTYTVIQTLCTQGSEITYQNLVERARLGIENLVPAQTPLYDGVGQGKNSAKAMFLNNAFANESNSHLVNFTTKDGWKIDVGSIDGLQKGAKIQLEDNSIVAVTEVFPAFAKIDMPAAARGISPVLKAKILDWGQPKVGIVFAIESEMDGKLVLQDTLKNYPSDYFELTGNSNTAVYRILVKEGYYALLKPNDNTPMFMRIKGGYNATQAGEFIDAVERVCKYDYIKNLANPSSSIRDVDIDITIKKIDEQVFKKGDDLLPYIDETAPEYWKFDIQQAKSVDAKDLSKPVLLKYTKVNSIDVTPALFVRVTNRSNKPLYVGAVFCASNYDLTNNFIPDASGVSRIEPGKFVDLKDGEYSALSLFLRRKGDGYEGLYYPDSISEISIAAQFIVSTDLFDISKYAQDGLLLEEKEVITNRATQGRAAQVKIAADKPDWRTKTVNFILQRPTDNATFAPDAPAKLNGMVVKGNSKISAKAVLANTAHATRDVGADSMPNFTAQGLQPFNFEEGVGDMTPLNVLELKDFEDVKQLKKVTAANPFILELNDALPDNETVIPLGCFEVEEIDAATGAKRMRKWYAPIGTLAADGKTISITQLPEPNSAGTRSLTGSVKIFFQKVVMGKKTHPILQQVTVKRTAELTEEDLERIGRQSQSLNDEFITVTLSTSADEIKQSIAKAKRIALFVHGIIGDTEVMAQSIKKAKTWQKRNGVDTEVFISDYYDVVLTFDYENLNTSIAENANSLRLKLKEIGLGNNHGKELHIIAHSMGGLVSRWMIEKNCTQNVVQYLIQLGTPNAGTEITNVTDYCKKNLPKLLNAAGAFLGIPTPLTTALAWGASKTTDAIMIALDELSPSSPIIKYINDGTDPCIPYAIIAGSTIEMQEEKTLWQRLTSPYDLATILIYHEDNDLAVRVNSIFGIKGLEHREIPTEKALVKCDHITYFTSAVGLDALAKMVALKCE